MMKNSDCAIFAGPKASKNHMLNTVSGNIKRAEYTTSRFIGMRNSISTRKKMAILMIAQITDKSRRMVMDDAFHVG